METEVLEIRTGTAPAIVDVTSRVVAFCAGRGDGLVSAFLPHATAGLAVVETGSGTEQDLIASLDGILPRDDGRWRHRHGAPGHGADHVLPAFVSPSLVVPVLDGEPALGTWQSIVLVDTNVDNPVRRIRLSFLPARP